jgi:hypothetical protein
MVKAVKDNIRKWQLEPTTFSVTYSLKEYLHFVQNHSLIVMNTELSAREKSARDKVPI